MKPGVNLCLASLVFVLAAVYCCFNYARWRDRRSEAAETVAPAGREAPAVVVTTPPARSPATARRVPLEISPRVKAMLDATTKTFGGTPQPRPESLFAEVPALKAAFDKAAAAQMRLGYEQFFRTVTLSPDEEARFLKILADREATWADVRASATTQGLALTDPSLPKLDERNMAATETDLRALLGEARYSQLQDYRGTLDARLGLLSLNTLVATSYRTDTPVTLDQINRLAKLTTDSGVLNYTQAMARPDGVPFDQVIAEARKILTPAQAEVFELLVDQRQISLARSRIYQDRLKK